MDLHPHSLEKRFSVGASTGTPCGFTDRILGDLYGSKQMNLLMDEDKGGQPPAGGGVEPVDGQDCLGEDARGERNDKSGLIWLLGDPSQIEEKKDPGLAALPAAPDNNGKPAQPE